jgi:excisionase family DNA binding protein
MKKTYLTPNQVAELLMVSPATVRQWAEKGELLAYTTPGGHRRFRPDDVECFASSRGLQLNLQERDARRLLIVDDDTQLSTYLSELLQSIDTPMVTEMARDGFSAGLKVRKFKPQTILLDLKMSGLDGLQVCRLLKADPVTRPIKVVVMSGYLTPEAEEDALQAGAEACLSKPINVKELMQLLALPGKP